MGHSPKRRETKPPSVEDPTKTKPLPVDEGSSLTSASARPNTPPLASDDAALKNNSERTAMKDGKPGKSLTKQVRNKSSWYGTWPRKSTASTHVARDFILADKPIPGSSMTDLSRFEDKKSPPATPISAATRPATRPPSMHLGKSRETVDVTMGITLEEDNSASKKECSASKKATKSNLLSAGDSAMDTPREVETKAKPAEATPHVQLDSPSEASSARSTTASGWLGGWLHRTSMQSPSPETTLKAPKVTAEPTEPDLPSEPEQTKLALSADDVAEPPAAHMAVKGPSSWFGLWTTVVRPINTEAPAEQLPNKMADLGEDTVVKDAPIFEPASQPAGQPAAGSSWAFWSSETPKKASDSFNKPETGELAVADGASRTQPEPASLMTVKDNKKSIASKPGRSPSTEVSEAAQKILQQDANCSTLRTAVAHSPLVKTSPPNLLIPSVRNTYRLTENHSILQQIARLLRHGQQKHTTHIFLAKETPKVRRALAIGVHGLFPAPLLRTVIGQPTGTSIRFANHAADAIRRWTDSHGFVECEIEKVALEGEGKIAERVDNLWKLLLNWIDHVRKADFVLVACHSQGVPVALMLVAKLIEFGVVTTGRIAVCAMAGVSLGPFADYKSRLFSGSAGELFEFADPDSVVSKRYEDSLRVALKYGVRVTYCGSIDDQLVSMESSVFSTASHPYIYRAVFVDGRIHAPDFLSHLVGFALKLRNLGISDHGLIRELSAPLAGSLYTGAGHSRLYDDGKVYDLAVEYALETTSVDDVPLEMKKYEIPTNANPYMLPWIMRGLLEEDFVKTELDQETADLLKQFDDWRPATKVLKDVKYRLEAVRSKL